MGKRVNNAAAEKAAQKMNGNPGFRPAKLLPRGGEITVPIWLIDKTIPRAVPKSFGPIPSVSNSMVTLIAIKPSIKMPDMIIKIQIGVPSTAGNRPKQIMVTIRAGSSIAFLEPALSDREDNGTTHIVLIP